jgi:hypothetical protein
MGEVEGKSDLRRSGVVAHAYNPSDTGGKDRRIVLQASLDKKCETQITKSKKVWGQGQVVVSV